MNPLTRLSHAQVMDLPVGVWDKVSQHMEFTDWARACGTSHASYASWRRLVAAELRSTFWNCGRVDMSQLQLRKWAYCHSLNFNLRRLHEAGKLTPAEVAEIGRAAGTLPQLRCLHIIGRPKVPLMMTSVEGVLMSILAIYATVLTLRVRGIKMPLEFPHLQHLVLDLGAKGDDEDDGEPFLSISILNGLKTLFVQSSDKTIMQPIDLTGCMHLQHLAVQDTKLNGTLTLPEKCRLRMTFTKNTDIASGVASLVSEATIYCSLPWLANLWPRKLGYLIVSWRVPALHNLKQLRLIVNQRNLGGEQKGNAALRLQVHIWEFRTPCLEVLELHARCDMSVFVSPEIRLASLAVFAAGTLDLSITVWSQLKTPNTTLKQMYLQSSKAFLPSYIEWPLTRDASLPLPQRRIRPLEYFKEGQHCWKARMPPSFQPNNLQECCCKACPKCLAQAGVPILCDQAWTRDGLKRHLRSQCRKDPRS